MLPYRGNFYVSCSFFFGAAVWFLSLEKHRKHISRAPIIEFFDRDNVTFIELDDKKAKEKFVISLKLINEPFQYKSEKNHSVIRILLFSKPFFPFAWYLLWFSTKSIWIHFNFNWFFLEFFQDSMHWSILFWRICLVNFHDSQITKDPQLAVVVSRSHGVCEDEANKLRQSTGGDAVALFHTFPARLCR